MKLIFTIILALICTLEVYGSSLEVVNDNELVNLWNSEQYVIVLFAKKDCQESEKFETEVLKIREDLVDSLSAWVVKAVDSYLLRLYSPSKEPALVFFRHGIPLLYDGELNEELILETFIFNKEPAVKELTDDNFEHLTQAASGATTGDWFVMFYSTNCVECKRLQARWETVGAKLKTRMNVAMVNRETTGRVTSRRFAIVDTPTFVLFRAQKMYRYNIPKYDIASFVTFATEWYRNARAEAVPVPKAPFDDLVQAVVDYMLENPMIWKIASMIISIIVLFLVRRKLTAVDKKAEKKSKKSKEKSKEK
ncbi:hypothetical protein LSTR_LSTR005006 [Laodelphax striatellus]|uniref:Thioredoxin domain-containing protein n=1 Tax=Laodelphax striatellus TaxID=195883 RepID=A0A482XKA4_LAOST|nr:hypothetical protein LSTR_LSTR005006 [Laodelphax striatellus]